MECEFPDFAMHPLGHQLPREGDLPEFGIQAPPITSSIEELLLSIVRHGWQFLKFNFARHHPVHQVPTEGDFPDSAMHHLGHQQPREGAFPDFAMHHPGHQLPTEGDLPDFAMHHPGHQLLMEGCTIEGGGKTQKSGRHPKKDLWATHLCWLASGTAPTSSVVPKSRDLGT